MQRSLGVTNAGGEPGRTIARALASAGDGVSNSLTEALQRYGCIDSLVNCYRLDGSPVGPLEDIDADGFMAGMAENLSDAFVAAQAAATRMLAQACPHSSDRRRGCIVNVTSVAGVLALPGQATFCAAMAALSTATKVLATEWAPHGIRVAAVGAGLTPELLQGLRGLPGASRRIPAGCVVNLELVAETVKFVLSDAGAGIAGVPVYVDSGWLSDGYWEAFTGTGEAVSQSRSANATS
jgi:NAD(P)-dependent dehydrogenase (short-subunit alcohol dehydrogenase family)